MDFLISESQLRTILMEQDKSKMTDYMKQLHSFTSNLVNRVNKVYGINLKMLSTWGASVGGLVMPLDRFIRTGQFNLDDDQRMLVLAGVAFMIFFEGKRGIGKILEKIKEEGIEDTFKIILNKAKELKSSFLDFLASINIVKSTLMDTVAYSFLIPIITDIYSIAIKSSNIRESVILIVERLLASGFVILSSEALSSIIGKIIKKFR